MTEPGHPARDTVLAEIRKVAKKAHAHTTPEVRLALTGSGRPRLEVYLAEGWNTHLRMLWTPSGQDFVDASGPLRNMIRPYAADRPASTSEVEYVDAEGQLVPLEATTLNSRRKVYGTWEQLRTWFTGHGAEGLLLAGEAAETDPPRTLGISVFPASFVAAGGKPYDVLGGGGEAVEAVIGGLVGLGGSAVAGVLPQGRIAEVAGSISDAVGGVVEALEDFGVRIHRHGGHHDLPWDESTAREFLTLCVTFDPYAREAEDTGGLVVHRDCTDLPLHKVHRLSKTDERAIASLGRVGEVVLEQLVPELFRRITAAAPGTS